MTSLASKSPTILVPANSDLADKLGVVVFASIPCGHLFSPLVASLFASFRSRAALQLEILPMAGVAWMVFISALCSALVCK